jgi:hypothetical protein
MGFLYLPKRAGPSLHLHDNTGLPAPLSGGTGRVVQVPGPSIRQRRVGALSCRLWNVSAAAALVSTYAALFLSPDRGP